MNAILASITNRDIAVFIWLTIFLVWMLTNHDIQKSLHPLMKMILFSRLTPYFIAIVCYVSLLIYLASKVGIWDVGMLKDTLYWFLGIAIMLSVRINDALIDDHYFKKAVLENLRLAVLLEFILNFYVFSLVVELLLVPVVTVLTMLIVVGNLKAEFAQTKKVLQWLSTLIGISLLIHALIQLITDFQSLVALENLKILLLPIVLTILFIPFVYIASLYAAYGLIFTRLKIFEHDKTLAKFTIWQVVKASRFRISRVKLFSRKFTILAGTAKDRDEVMVVIANYKSELR